MSPLDVAVTQEVQEQRPGQPLMTALMLAISLPGDYPWAELIVTFACLVLLLIRQWRPALLVLLTVTGDGMALVVKALIQRPRPGADVVQIYKQPQGYSFPSGHVVHYVVFLGALAYLACEALRSSPPGRTMLRAGLVAIVGTCWVLVVLISLSRMYLGAHWLSDVLGGYLLGGAWLVGLLAIYRRWEEPGSTTLQVKSALAGASGASARAVFCWSGGAHALRLRRW